MKFNWGHGILAFIILFLLLSTAAIIFSLNQSEDLVSDDYYEQGAAYSKQMEISKRSSIFHDSVSVNSMDAVIELNLCKSLAVSGDTLYAFFYSPSDKKSDLKLKFPMAEKINISSAQLNKGRYVVKMSWNHQGNLYNIDKEVILK
ncbi:MAG: FixH family protein [Bacteroidota bacterium]